MLVNIHTRNKYIIQICAHNRIINAYIYTNLILIMKTVPENQKIIQSREGKAKTKKLLYNDTKTKKAQQTMSCQR